MATHAAPESPSICFALRPAAPLIAFLLLCLPWSNSLLRGEEFSPPTDEQAAFFEAKIRPVLVEECYACHATDAKIIRGGLRLDSPNGWRTGGDSGPALVPGKPEESLLIQALRHDSLEMPPERKLPPEVIDNFIRWVEWGAPDPRPDTPAIADPTGIDLAQGRGFWAFRPAVRHDTPVVVHENWAHSDIDRFLLAAQERAGLGPGSDAAKSVLIRRLSFDLIGLPPTPDELDKCLSDNSPDWLPRYVDRLLGSTRFGERWGRHWLDVARYADSTGGGRSMLYKEAWRYRDYVIAAFNSDKPFDRFIVEQIAGDLLPFDTVAAGREQLIATAFLALGPSNFENQDKDQLRMDVVDEQIDTVGKAFLAMTLGCARCHDHKFDPIPTADYYALAGIFRSTQTLVHANVSTWLTRPWPIPAEEQRRLDDHAREVAELTQAVQLQTNEVELAEAVLRVFEVDDDQAQLVGDWKESKYVKRYAGRGYRHASRPDAAAHFQTDLPAGRYRVEVAYNGGPSRTAQGRVTLKDRGLKITLPLNQKQAPDINDLYKRIGEFDFGPSAAVTIEAGDEQFLIIDAVRFIQVGSPDGTTTPQLERWNQATAELHALKQRLEECQKRAPARPTQVVCVAEEETTEDCRIGIRGSVKNLGEVAPRGFLCVCEPEGVIPSIAEGTSGRLELARWIARDDHPLTARVIVNRVWEKLFGQGLVRTVDNFGTTGEVPSHPELLDTLAVQFVQDGWSLKRLIRRIVLSRSYQLASESINSGVDPENRLLTRQNRRRLDAESLHDAFLRMSGELNEQMGGYTVEADGKDEYSYEFRYGRRAVYLPILRNRLPDILAVFDFPDPNLSRGRRTSSTLPAQALFVMNSPFVLDRAERTADRLLAMNLTDEDRLDWLARYCFSRPPTPTEKQLVLKFLNRSNVPARERWQRICQMLPASVSFRYVE